MWVCVCVSVCVCVYVFVCMHVYVYMCTCVCVCVMGKGKVGYNQFAFIRGPLEHGIQQMEGGGDLMEGIMASFGISNVLIPRAEFCGLS